MCFDSRSQGIDAVILVFCESGHWIDRCGVVRPEFGFWFLVPQAVVQLLGFDSVLMLFGLGNNFEV